MGSISFSMYNLLIISVKILPHFLLRQDFQEYTPIMLPGYAGPPKISAKLDWNFTILLKTKVFF